MKTDAYVTSQWQRSNKVSYAYVCYRWAMAAMAVGAFTLSYLTPFSGTTYVPPADSRPAYAKWFLYATNLGFLHLVFQAILGLYVTQVAYNDQRRLSIASTKEYNFNNNTHDNGHKSNGVAPKGHSYWQIERYRRICSVYRYFYAAAAAHAIEISVIYWCYMYKPGTHVIDAVNLMSHLFNTVFMVIETFVVRINSRISDAPGLLLSGVVYGLITYPYWMLGGTDRFGGPNLYPFLDYTKPTVAIIFLAIISFGATLMLLVHMVAQSVRQFLHRTIVGR